VICSLVFVFPLIVLVSLPWCSCWDIISCPGWVRGGFDRRGEDQRAGL